MSDGSSDEALMFRWRDGDGAAGAELYDRRARDVDRFLRNMVSSDKSDLIQEIFSRVLRAVRKPDFRLQTTFHCYLMGVARNTLFEYFRRKSRRGWVDLSEMSLADLALEEPEEVVERRRERALVYRALRRVPLEDQVLLELHYFQELTDAAIAQICGLSKEATKSRRRRALKRLRRIIPVLATSEDEATTTIRRLKEWARRIGKGAIGAGGYGT